MSLQRLHVSITRTIHLILFLFILFFLENLQSQQGALLSADNGARNPENVAPLK